MNDDKNKNLRSLAFSVNGTPTVVEKVNVNQPLHVAVNKALEQTGNTGRPISDWIAQYNDQQLNINLKVEDFNFPPDAVIFLSLKSAEGGEQLR